MQETSRTQLLLSDNASSSTSNHGPFPYTYVGRRPSLDDSNSPQQHSQSPPRQSPTTALEYQRQTDDAGSLNPVYYDSNRELHVMQPLNWDASQEGYQFRISQDRTNHQAMSDVLYRQSIYLPAASSEGYATVKGQPGMLQRGNLTAERIELSQRYAFDTESLRSLEYNNSAREQFPFAKGYSDAIRPSVIRRGPLVDAPVQFNATPHAQALHMTSHVDPHAYVYDGSHSADNNWYSTPTNHVYSNNIDLSSTGDMNASSYFNTELFGVDKNNNSYNLAYGCHAYPAQSSHGLINFNAQYQSEHERQSSTGSSIMRSDGSYNTTDSSWLHSDSNRSETSDASSWQTSSTPVTSCAPVSVTSSGSAKLNRHWPPSMVAPADSSTVTSEDSSTVTSQSRQGVTASSVSSAGGAVGEQGKETKQRITPWQSIGKTRTYDKYRHVYTEWQRLELEREYGLTEYITPESKTRIALGVGLSERQIKIWFQNRRAKDRRAKQRGVLGGEREREEEEEL